jgi:hypothetical protein
MKTMFPKLSLYLNREAASDGENLSLFGNYRHIFDGHQAPAIGFTPPAIQPHGFLRSLDIGKIARSFEKWKPVCGTFKCTSEIIEIFQMFGMDGFKHTLVNNERSRPFLSPSLARFDYCCKPGPILAS